MTANVQMSIPFSDYILSFGNASFQPQCPSDTITYVGETPENGSELQFRTLFAVCLLLILLGTTISNSGLSGLRQI